MKYLISLGWISAVLFIVGISLMDLLVDGYDPVVQTTIDLGNPASSVYFIYHVFIITVDLMVVLFGCGIIAWAREWNFAILPGLFVVAFGLGDLGTVLFSSPLFDIQMLLMVAGLFTPLVFAIRWRDTFKNSFRRISLLAFSFIVLGIALSMIPMTGADNFLSGYYGIVQRFLFYTFYLYCFYLSFSMVNNTKAKRESFSQID